MSNESNIQCNTCDHKGVCKYEDLMRHVTENTATMSMLEEVNELKRLGLNCTFTISCDKFQPILPVFR